MRTAVGDKAAFLVLEVDFQGDLLHHGLQVKKLILIDFFRLNLVGDVFDALQYEFRLFSVSRKRMAVTSTCTTFPPFVSREDLNLMSDFSPCNN